MSDHERGFLGMTSEHKLWSFVVFIVGGTLAAIAWAVSWGYVNSWKTITENGYVQQQIQSTTYAGKIWVKPGQEQPPIHKPAP